MRREQVRSVPSAARYVTIDAWRGAACLGVLVFHCFGSSMHQPIWGPLEWVRAVARHGWLGLHIFFVLSGYCIFERIRAALRHDETPGAFLLDRALRIYPTYVAVLITSIAMNLLASPLNHTSFAQNVPPSPGYWLSNFTLVHVFVGDTPYLLVTWTLACEMVFYVIAAGLLTVARNGRGLGFAFGTGAVLCFAAFAVREARWTMPLALWPDFFAGICVAMALAGKRTPALVVLGALTVAAWLQLQPYATDARKVVTGFAWVLFVLHPVDGVLARRGVVRVLGWVGVFSFSLYLLHVQLAGRIINLSSRFVPIISATFGLVLLIALATALAGGWLFWRMVERRCEVWRVDHRLRLAHARSKMPA